MLQRAGKDLHGHSKKEGIFFYGGKAEDRDRNADIRLLPRLRERERERERCLRGLESSNPNLFSLMSIPMSLAQLGTGFAAWDLQTSSGASFPAATMSAISISEK